MGAPSLEMPAKKVPAAHCLVQVRTLPCTHALSVPASVQHGMEKPDALEVPVAHAPPQVAAA